MTSRALAAGLSAILVAATLLYAAFVEPMWLQINRVSLKTVDAPPLVIAQLSDLHLRVPGTLEARIIEALRRHSPDVIVLSGDVVDSEEGLVHLPALLAQLPAAARFAVLGNWEHWSDIDLKKLRMLYQEAGVTLLVNNSQRVVIRGRTLRIAGQDDYTAGEPRLTDGDDAGGSELTLLVQHSPGYFESENRAPTAKYDLCIAGHTHGGQVTLFGLPIWLPPGSGNFVHGLHEHAMCPLYVSRGLGTSLLPMRLWARPEIVLFEI